MKLESKRNDPPEGIVSWFGMEDIFGYGCPVLTVSVARRRGRHLTIMRALSVIGAALMTVMSVVVPLRTMTALNIISARALILFRSIAWLRAFGTVFVRLHFGVVLLKLVRFHLLKKLLVNFFHLLLLICGEYRAEETYVCDALIKALLIERDEFRAHGLQICFGDVICAEDVVKLDFRSFNLLADGFARGIRCGFVGVHLRHLIFGKVERGVKLLFGKHSGHLPVTPVASVIGTVHLLHFRLGAAEMAGTFECAGSGEETCARSEDDTAYDKNFCVTHIQILLI